MSATGIIEIAHDDHRCAATAAPCPMLLVHAAVRNL